MERIETIKIAVLLTCHNRRQKTLSFLQSLINQNIFNQLQIDIYLLDDGSTDGTSEAIHDKYPFIKLQKGNGDLFWAGGMRKIWEFAISQKKYDLFLLFNDDVFLFENALEKIISNYMQLNREGIILIGSALSPVSNKHSYGGYILNNIIHSKYYVVEPNDNKSKPCQLGNANILLVDAKVVEKIGVLSASYTHILADFDYTLTGYKAGLAVLIAPGYYAYCENDHGINWLPAKHSLKKRIQYLYSPKGLAYKEYLYYIKKHFPLDYFSAFIKLWMKTLFPIIWDKFKRRDDN